MLKSLRRALPCVRTFTQNIEVPTMPDILSQLAKDITIKGAADQFHHKIYEAMDSRQFLNMEHSKIPISKHLQSLLDIYKAAATQKQFQLVAESELHWLCRNLVEKSNELTTAQNKLIMAINTMLIDNGCGSFLLVNKLHNEYLRNEVLKDVHINPSLLLLAMNQNSLTAKELMPYIQVASIQTLTQLCGILEEKELLRVKESIAEKIKVPTFANITELNDSLFKAKLSKPSYIEKVYEILEVGKFAGYFKYLYNLEKYNRCLKKIQGVALTYNLLELNLIVDEEYAVYLYTNFKLIEKDLGQPNPLWENFNNIFISLQRYPSVKNMFITYCEEAIKLPNNLSTIEKINLIGFLIEQESPITSSDEYINLFKSLVLLPSDQLRMNSKTIIDACKRWNTFMPVGIKLMDYYSVKPHINRSEHLDILLFAVQNLSLNSIYPIIKKSINYFKINSYDLIKYMLRNDIKMHGPNFKTILPFLTVYAKDAHLLKILTERDSFVYLPKSKPHLTTANEVIENPSAYISQKNIFTNDIIWSQINKPNKEPNAPIQLLYNYKNINNPTKIYNAIQSFRSGNISENEKEAKKLIEYYGQNYPHQAIPMLLYLSKYHKTAIDFSKYETISAYGSLSQKCDIISAYCVVRQFIESSEQAGQLDRLIQNMIFKLNSSDITTLLQSMSNSYGEIPYYKPLVKLLIETPEQYSLQRAPAYSFFKYTNNTFSQLLLNSLPKCWLYFDDAAKLVSYSDINYDINIKYNFFNKNPIIDLEGNTLSQVIASEKKPNLLFYLLSKPEFKHFIEAIYKKEILEGIIKSRNWNLVLKYTYVIKNSSIKIPTFLKTEIVNEIVQSKYIYKILQFDEMMKDAELFKINKAISSVYKEGGIEFPYYSKDKYITNSETLCSCQ